MFVKSNGEIDDGFECGNKPVTRPQWCRVRYLTINDEPSMTVDSEANNTDINDIVARFSRTGQLPNVNEENAQYADVTGLQVDLTEAINQSRANIQTYQEFGEKWEPAPEEQPRPPDPAPTTPPAAA